MYEPVANSVNNLTGLSSQRLAKEILVKERSAVGESCSFEDYEGRTLGPLIADLTPYLRDQADRGKWRTINDWLSPGHHDAPPPARADLKMAYGDLRTFHKTYIKT